jgi:hypothetical protein
VRIGLGWEDGNYRRKAVYGDPGRGATEAGRGHQGDAEGEYVATANAAVLEEFTSPWLVGKRLRLAASTYRNYEMHVRLHIVSKLGRIRLNELRDSVLQRWVNGLPAGSARNVQRALTAILHAAVRQRLIARNPAVGLEVPRRPPPHIRSDEQRAVRSRLRRTRPARGRPGVHRGPPPRRLLRRS